MNAEKVSGKIAKVSHVIPFYVFCLVLSTIMFTIIFIVSIDPAYLHLIPFIFYAFFVMIAYLLFAVPFQIILNKRPRKFNIVYLFIYMLLAIMAVFLYVVIFFNEESTILLAMKSYYIYSFIGAIIYWFWDSVFLQRKNEGNG